MSEVFVLIEHTRGRVKPASLNAIMAAKQLGQDVSLVVIGCQLEEIVTSLAVLDVKAILVADDPILTHPLADKYSTILALMMERRGAKSLVASSSTFSKDILPRVAALLDAPMVSDVFSIQRQELTWEFDRPMYAGRIRGTLSLEDGRFVISVLPSAFETATPARISKDAMIEKISINPDSLPSGMEFVSKQVRQSPRPDLSEAKVVVSGGRPLQDSETFERLIGGLADVFQGAVACTRAAVDCGIAPNDCQVGQTGKVIAPDLYIGVGVSGAIQHIAGMKDARVIVAINKDPEAPIFQIANYGLVGDLNEIVPQLIQELAHAGYEKPA
jgi:electron transfer flavoprotein alpha subunit